MLPYPSQKFFRQLLLFALVVWIGMFLVEYTNYDVRTDDEATALSWNYFGATLPYLMISIVYWIQIIMFGVGLLAMIFLQGWGRLLILGSIVIDFLSTSFMGLVVTTGSMDMLALLAGILTGIPFILSFFEPCASYFNKPTKMQNKT